MELTSATPPGRQFIQAYGDGGFRIAGVAYRSPVLVLPEETRPWPVTRAEDAALDNLGPVIEIIPAAEILVLGCGAQIRRVDAALAAALRGRGVFLEVMDTGAACRTYNVLLAEDRRVAAAMIPVP